MRTAIRAIVTVAVVGFVCTARTANAQVYQVGSFTKKTSGAPDNCTAPCAQQVTLPQALGDTPKALILWSNGKTNTSFSGSYLWGFGMTDGSSTWSAGAGSQNNVGSSSGSQASRRDWSKVMQFLQGTTSTGTVCTSTCTQSVPSGTVITVVAPGTPSFSGACGTQRGGCAVRVEAPARVTAASFGPLARVLWGVNVTSSGPGTVTSRPSGIDCAQAPAASEPCEYALPAGPVVLSAQPTRGFRFVRWGDYCARFGQKPLCRIVLPIPGGVDATFGRRH